MSKLEMGPVMRDGHSVVSWGGGNVQANECLLEFNFVSPRPMDYKKQMFVSIIEKGEREPAICFCFGLR